MHQRGRVRYVFAGTYSPKGYCTYLPELVKGLKKVFILKGPPGTGKSTLIYHVGMIMMEKGYNIDLLSSSTDQDAFEGVIVSELKLAIIDGSPPHTVDPLYPGVVEEIINLGDLWEAEKLHAHLEEIVDNFNQREANLQKATQYLETAKEIYDNLSSINQSNVDINQIKDLSEKLLGEIFAHPQPQIKHLFVNGLTAKGLVDYIDNITAHCSRRYIIKSDPGTGKDIIIKKIIGEAIKQGYQVEAFHGAYDPEAIELVLLNQLSIAIVCINSSYMLNNRSGDRIIDLQQFLQGGNEEAQKVRLEFDLTVAQAVKCLAEVQKTNEKLESYYSKAMDFTLLEKLQETILSKASTLEQKDFKPLA
ncbi:hypothetical protein RDV78_08985 [Bacillota bacterium LX-D]|nr:hypothetical protein [Bacillota bacterium LX-D]